MRKFSCLLLLSAAVALLLGCQSAKAEAAPLNYRKTDSGVEAVDISQMADSLLACLTSEYNLLNLQLPEEELARLVEKTGAVVLGDCAVIGDALGRKVEKILILQEPESLLVVDYGDLQEYRSY